jgi:GNAT acetyltransferase-like protein
MLSPARLLAAVTRGTGGPACDLPPCQRRARVPFRGNGRARYGITGAVGRRTLHRRDCGWSERELGWGLARKHWGRGYAFVAAVAGRDYALRSHQWKRLVCYVIPENRRSIRLAERLFRRRCQLLVAVLLRRRRPGVHRDSLLVYTDPAPEVEAAAVLAETGDPATGHPVDARGGGRRRAGIDAATLDGRVIEKAVRRPVRRQLPGAPLLGWWRFDRAIVERKLEAIPVLVPPRLDIGLATVLPHPVTGRSAPRRRCPVA